MCPLFARTRARRRQPTALVNCIVNDALVHATPNVQHKLLQFVTVIQQRLMDSLLDDAHIL